MIKTDYGIVKMVNSVNDGTVKTEKCCLRLFRKEQSPNITP